MAIIPSDEKVFMVNTSTNTTYSGSASLKAMQKWYTMQDIADSVGGGPDYLVYTALISTDFSGNVFVIILENTIGNITWAMNTPFGATGTLTGAFEPAKTWISAITNTESGYFVVTSATLLSNDSIEIVAYDVSSTFPALMINSYVEIRVYN